MSRPSDAFFEKDAFHDSAEERNGRPDLDGASRLGADQKQDSSLPPQSSEEGGAEAPKPAALITEPAVPNALPEVEPSPVPEPATAFAIPLTDEPLFARYEYPPPLPPRRKPDLSDLLLFAVLVFGAWLCSGLLVLVAMHYHLFGVSTVKQANDEIHYRLGSQAAWYLITLIFCIAIFPLAWRRSFFEGMQWRAGAAAGRIWRLIGAASACFVAAIIDQFLMPGPANTPIDETFHMPGAVWLLFAFGITLAPLIEEIAYRGLLLPALCSLYDWSVVRLTGSAPSPLDADGFPRWSTPAMIAASLLVSVPFALMHGEQTSYSIGPFLLLICISLALCWVRLALRSLAASVVVHSSYNLLLFSLMFLGTGGFRHMDRM
jgi:hypothetical protein